MTGGNLSIRNASLGDLAAILAIERACFADAWREETIEKSLQAEHTITLVAMSDTHTIGYASAWVIGDEGEISRLAVFENERARGIGSALLGELLRQCHALGAERMYLEVRDGNIAARRLYLAGGFFESGRRKRYYADGEDAVIMCRVRH
jgi:ribosomal-protein-alanine N-acetyltransferase